MCLQPSRIELRHAVRLRRARPRGALALLALLALAGSCKSQAIYLGSDRAASGQDGEGTSGAGGSGAGNTGASAGSNGNVGSGLPGTGGVGNTPGSSGEPNGAAGSTTPSVPACPAGFGDCDGDASNGCETDVLSTTAHCGGCNQPCPRIIETVGSTCVNGMCNPICEPLHEDCDGRIENGCEAHLFIDPNNCGACGVVCRCNGAGQCE